MESKKFSEFKRGVTGKKSKRSFRVSREGVILVLSSARQGELDMLTSRDEKLSRAVFAEKIWHVEGDLHECREKIKPLLGAF